MEDDVAGNVCQGLPPAAGMHHAAHTSAAQGLTLVHYSACREQFLCGFVVDLVVSMAKTAQVELRSGRV